MILLLNIKQLIGYKEKAPQHGEPSLFNNACTFGGRGASPGGILPTAGYLQAALCIKQSSMIVYLSQVIG